MILSSKITNHQYQWIRIPRTGTTSYLNLFNINDLKYPRLNVHNQFGKFHVCENCRNLLPPQRGFSVVRHPKERFISMIYFLVDLKENPEEEKTRTAVCENCKIIALTKSRVNTNFFKFYENEKIFYEFFYDNFNKNCELKAGVDYQSIFKTDGNWPGNPFFLTQVHWAYHPRVKIFKYENLTEFNDWIETEFGFNTKLLRRTNVSPREALTKILNINFSDNKFNNLVKYLFYDDFSCFGYDI
jgi:hypothetical protein